MEVLPPELLDRVLRATGLTAAAAHRVLPRVCRAWRAALARLAASEEPLAAPLAVACGAARALLLLDVAAPDGVGASPACLTPRLLARFDIPLSRGVEDDGGGGGADAAAGGYAWPTYVARAGPAADDGTTPLLLCEYARAGLMLLDVSLAPGAAAVRWRGSISDAEKLGCPEGVACGRDGRVYVASVGASGETPACVSLVAAPPVAAAAPLKPTHGTDGVPLLGQSLPRVRQQRVMPDILGNGVTATPWDVARGPASDPDALYVLVHTNAGAEDFDPDADDDAHGGGGPVPPADPAYLRPTAFPTGGVLRLGLARSGRFAGRAAWAVPPHTALLNRPSGIAFSADGGVAYVATFLFGRGRDRGVLAFSLPSWTPLPRWDAGAAPARGAHPWALAVCRRSGALLAACHGGGAGHVLARLCGATGALRATWRHEALDGAAPNAIAFL